MRFLFFFLLNGPASARRNEEREKRSALEHCRPESHQFLSWAFTAISVGLPDVQEAWTTTPALTLTLPEWEKGPLKEVSFPPPFYSEKSQKYRKVEKIVITFLSTKSVRKYFSYTEKKRKWYKRHPCNILTTQN